MISPKITVVFASLVFLSLPTYAAPKIILDNGDINPEVNNLLKPLGISLPTTQEEFQQTHSGNFPTESSVRYSKECQEKILTILQFKQESVQTEWQEFIQKKHEFMKTPPQSFFGRKVDILTEGSSNYDGIFHRLKAIVDQQEKGKLEFKKVVFLTGGDTKCFRNSRTIINL